MAHYHFFKILALLASVLVGLRRVLLVYRRSEERVDVGAVGVCYVTIKGVAKLRARGLTWNKFLISFNHFTFLALIMHCFYFAFKYLISGRNTLPTVAFQATLTKLP